MASKLICLLAVLVATTAGQRLDDFTCPDSLPGFYPHLYSCDKYWACSDGEAEQRTCGNGLGFIDTDETFTLEQCAELHLVECGERTELEPAISSPHCPRAWGTYEDEEDCSVFWVCMAGKATRYSCPPGLAYDKESRGCRWADQVAECSGLGVVDEVGGQFQCPTSPPGVFTKHAHPEDCRQYYLCIGGLPREYGCPLGTVFNTGTGNGEDGECSDPEQVPECREYYGDQEFDTRLLSSNGFSGGEEGRERARSSNSQQSRNSLTRPSSGSEQAQSEQFSRPAPVALQQILDRPSASRARPARPTTTSPAPPPPTPPSATQRPARLEVITNRPSLRNNLRQSLLPTDPTTPPTTQTSFSRSRPFSARFGTNNSPRISIGSSNRFRPTPAPTTTTSTTTTTAPPPPPPPARGEGLPPPVKAAPGPNGEDYYYYYYYYDDEEQV